MHSSSPDHRIRLRGPWEFEWLKSSSGMANALREGCLELPAIWREEFGDALGTVRLSRRFGRPSGAQEPERVWLEIASECEVTASLNGEWLGTFAAGAVRFDVTRRLSWRNRLDLDLTRDEPATLGAPLAEVALVIEETA
jgi:hypothetical protein